MSYHVDCCTIRCSQGSRFWALEKNYGRGCDLVIENDNCNLLVLVEAKRGRITLQDANKAVTQLIAGKEIINGISRYKTFKCVMAFVHCRQGRIDNEAVRFFRKHRIYVFSSNEDLINRLRRYIRCRYD